MSPGRSAPMEVGSDTQPEDYPLGRGQVEAQDLAVGRGGRQHKQRQHAKLR